MHAYLGFSQKVFYFLLTFFLDEKSNKKVKHERQLPNLHAQKAFALFAVNCVVRSVRARPPHFYQRMRYLYARFFCQLFKCTCIHFNHFHSKHLLIKECHTFE